MGFVAGGGVKVGVIEAFGGQVAPDGYLICDGGEISRTLYSDLFAVIGTTYGSGDGSTTFNLPNYTSARMVTSDTVAVNGNGVTLGLTDGTSNFALSTTTSDTDKNFYMMVKNNYGTNVGTRNGSSYVTGDLIGIGVTTDTTKSGLTGLVSLASSCNYIIKY